MKYDVTIDFNLNYLGAYFDQVIVSKAKLMLKNIEGGKVALSPQNGVFRNASRNKVNMTKRKQEKFRGVIER